MYSGHYQSSGNKLIIDGLRKPSAPDADDGDNAVYQCKAENKHGYAWVNFYLNILRTFILLMLLL